MGIAEWFMVIVFIIMVGIVAAGALVLHLNKKGFFQ